MHEVSLAREILSTALDRARALGYPGARVVSARIGAWTCVNPDLLARAFRAAAEEHGAAGMQLRIRIVTPECRCLDCGRAFEPRSFSLRCGQCGSARVVLERGREMQVESVEV